MRPTYCNEPQKLNKKLLGFITLRCDRLSIHVIHLPKVTFGWNFYKRLAMLPLNKSSKGKA